MSCPKVSVVTVVRNDKDHIEQTMLSVLNQTYAYFEYIVIDGGSTDGTLDVIKKYADRLSYWVSEPDGGIYPAMNKGVEQASGEWINFMNSGDTFADEKVLEDVFSRDLNVLQLIGGNTINFFADGHEEVHQAEGASAIPQHLPFSHQASFVRRELCRFNTRYRYAADYALFYDIFYRYGSAAIMTIDRLVARYKQEESVSMNNAKQVKGEYLNIQKSHPSMHWLKEYVKWRMLC